MSKNFKKRKIGENDIFYNLDSKLIKINHMDLINFKLKPIFNEYIEQFGFMYIKKEYIEDCVKYCNKLNYNYKIKNIKNCTKYIRLLYLFIEELNRYNELKRIFSKSNYSINNIKNIGLELKRINNIRKKDKERNIYIYPIIYHIDRMYEFYNILSDHNVILKNKLKGIFIEEETGIDYDFDRINEYWRSIEEIDI